MAETRAFDPARHLDGGEAIAAYVDEALQTGDATFVVHAIGVALRVRGMTNVDKAAGMSRESLYKALSDKGNPELSATEALG